MLGEPWTCPGSQSLHGQLQTQSQERQAFISPGSRGRLVSLTEWVGTAGHDVDGLPPSGPCFHSRPTEPGGDPQRVQGSRLHQQHGLRRPLQPGHLLTRQVVERGRQNLGSPWGLNAGGPFPNLSDGICLAAPTSFHPTQACAPLPTGVRFPESCQEEVRDQKQLLKDAAAFLLSCQIPGLVRDWPVGRGWCRFWKLMGPSQE